jgi:hypothetical protein
MAWTRLEQFKAFDNDPQTMSRATVALFLNDAPEHCTARHCALRWSAAAPDCRRLGLRLVPANLGRVAAVRENAYLMAQPASAKRVPKA